ncbi:hypothetical protein ILYODFUR_038230 [Ilyodon furcidens]|uniref:Uncharacterized protein n=1 Tax=Ilyodon furcidens TaxID=33524 RepID=A0ABV0U3Y7_9TELE
MHAPGSIHPLSSAYPSRSQGQQPRQRPRLPSPKPFGPAPLGESQGALRPAEKQSFQHVLLWSFGSPPIGAYPEHLYREASRRHPNQMLEPHQLAPHDVEEQLF